MPTFGDLLADYRRQATPPVWSKRREMSQQVLADLAEYETSYISRLESSQRMPTRECVLRLATAMGLTDRQRDLLLMAARFAPDDPRSLFDDEPELGAALAFVSNPTVPAEVRADVRNMIGILIRQARRAVPA